MKKLIVCLLVLTYAGTAFSSIVAYRPSAKKNNSNQSRYSQPTPNTTSFNNN